MTEASKMVPARVGDVVVTTAGDLGARYVFHAVTLGFDGLEIPGEAVVRQTTRKALELLPSLGCRSIAFPAIGAGVAGISYETVATQMATTIVSCLLGSSAPLRVEFYLLDRWGRMDLDDFAPFFEAFAARTMGVVTSTAESRTTLEPPMGDSAEDCRTARSGDIEDARRRHSIFEMLRHLDARRNQLEATLVDSLTGVRASTSESLSQIRAQLSELQELRLVYQSELASAAKKPAGGSAESVFLSSTSVDLQPHRKAVRSVIEEMKLRFIGMEDFTPSHVVPADYIQQRVLQADVYLGVLVCGTGPLIRVPVSR